MKEFLQLMRRFVSPYKRYIGWAIVLNVLSAIFNVFSFTLLIPILNILFKTGDGDKVYQFMVNGQNGKVGGKTPVSALRVAIAILLGIAIVVLLIKMFG